MGWVFFTYFWMFLFVWITLAELYLLTHQLLVYKFACMHGTYIVPTNLIPENYLITCTLFKFIYIFVQITSIEQWTLQHYQDFLSLMMEILLIKVTIITKLLIFFISVEQTKLSKYHAILYILSSHTHQFSFLNTVKFTVQFIFWITTLWFSEQISLLPEIYDVVAQK